MGFARGSAAAEELWRRLQVDLIQGSRQHAAEQIVQTFEDLDSDDWDTSSPGSVYCTARPNECDDNFGGR